MVLKGVLVHCDVINLLKYSNDWKDADKLFEFTKGSWTAFFPLHVHYLSFREEKKVISLP